MCSWSSWGSRTSDSARGRERIATNERPVLTDPGCSGLCPTRSASPLLLIILIVKLLSLHPGKITSFWFMITVSHSATIHLSKEPDSLLSITSTGTGGTSPLKPSLLQVEPAPLPQALLTGEVLQPWLPRELSAELTAVCWQPSCTGGPELNLVS